MPPKYGLAYSRGRGSSSRSRGNPSVARVNAAPRSSFEDVVVTMRVLRAPPPASVPRNANFVFATPGYRGRGRGRGGFTVASRGRGRGRGGGRGSIYDVNIPRYRYRPPAVPAPFVPTPGSLAETLMMSPPPVQRLTQDQINTQPLVTNLVVDRMVDHGENFLNRSRPDAEGESSVKRQKYEEDDDDL